MISITIGRGQGITHGLKAYAQYLGYDVSKITPENWNETIKRLEYIQRDRESAKQESIYSTDTTKSGWQGKMVVNEGKINFTDGEFESLVVSMGLQNKAEAFETWSTNSSIEPLINHGSLKINKDGNTDTNVYNKELEQLAKDYIKIYDENHDKKIDFDEFMIYKEEWYKSFHKTATEQQVNESQEGFKRVFNHLNIDNENDSKNFLDVREIMNYFNTMDAFNKDKQSDGYISELEFTLMDEMLKEKHTKQNDYSDIVQGYLNRNFSIFKNYKTK